jgi:hypothetical protein
LSLLETIALTLHLALSVIGVLIVILIMRVYRLYQKLKINRSVMTPMLFAGVFTAAAGMTEIIQQFTGEIGEIGEVIHAFTTVLAAAFFIYGIYGYHNMLDKSIKLR